jgi:hypothetical protein
VKTLTAREARILRECAPGQWFVGTTDDEMSVLRELVRRGLVREDECIGSWEWWITPLGRLAIAAHDALNVTMGAQ